MIRRSWFIGMVGAAGAYTGLEVFHNNWVAGICIIVTPIIIKWIGRS